MYGPHTYSVTMLTWMIPGLTMSPRSKGRDSDTRAHDSDKRPRSPMWLSRGRP